MQRYGGKIGMALVSMGYEPYNKTQFVDEQAQARSIDYNLGWFLEPMVRGDYPFSMRSLVGARLPFFTEAEQEKIKGSFDMLGLNYYTSRFSANINISPTVPRVLNTDDIYSQIGSTKWKITE
jgi:beta-glucosidase/6-phospho-beta-glucosidase/beta-galactosidase